MEIWNRIKMSAIILLLLIGCTTTIASAKAYSNIYPIDMSIYNPCSGEMIRFTGDEHRVENVFTDSNEGGHIIVRTNFQNVVGIGEISGTVYRNIESGFILQAWIKK